MAVPVFDWEALREVLDRRDFRLLWLGSGISQIGDWLQLTAQRWLILEETNSPVALTMVTASGLLSQLLFVLPGGLTVAQLLISAGLTLLVIKLRAPNPLRSIDPVGGCARFRATDGGEWSGSTHRGAPFLSGNRGN